MEIKIYTMSWCPHCNALKEYLENKKLDFKNIDVEEDEASANEIIERTGQAGFPVVCIDDKILIGFNKNKLEDALK
jgi:glutaredoxin 3